MDVRTFLARRLVAVAATIAAICSAPSANADAPRRLSLAQAVELALSESPDLAISARSVEAADARVGSSRALRLPRLVAEANALLWNEPLAFELTLPGVPLPPDEDATVTVRERVTAQAQVTLAQPLLGLLAVHHLIGADRAAAGAARADHAAARLDVAATVARAYLQALQATAARDIARAAVAQVEAQLERARVLVEVGALEPVDVMRLEAALAADRHQVLAAEADAALAADALALALGLPLHTPIVTFDDLPDPPPPPPWTVAEAEILARERRPELAAASRRAEQARAGRRAARADMLPQLDALASYQRTEGQGEFARRNAWFVGVTLQWDVWDWGHRAGRVAEAGALAAQAEQAASRLADQVASGARGRARAAHAAYEALAVARAGLAASEEAHRIQGVRYAEGAATTTDLLAAQTEVTQARLRYASTRYAYFIALTELDRQVGQQP